MKKQFKEWLKKKKNLNLFVSLFFVLGIGLFLGLSFLWAEDEVSKAKQAGESIGRSIQGGLGSSSAINQKLFQPLLTPALMYPLGGNESQGFRAQISCPSAKEFLKVAISPSSTGDLTLYISYDKGFTGSLNTSLMVSGVSAICSNGFMKCNPGTMADCSSYIFYLDGNELKYRMAVVSTGYGLSGCFCVNNACGGSNVLITNLNYVLRSAGGMVVSAFLNNPSRSSYVVSDSKIDGMSITFYGQDSSQCQFVDQGSSNVQNLKSYYQNPGALSSTGNVILGSQMGDSQSMASLVYGSSQLSSGDVKTCVIKRVASGCTVVEKTEGDCNVLSSCRVIEESWDGVPIIQGGARTKLNPIGSCVKDECGNLRCYDWTTKRVVYVCSGQSVFDPSPRIEAVTRSTTWDRATGMVYYNDTIIPDNCTADCPSGYVYSYASKKCEAPPVCPSMYSFDSKVNTCISTDPNVCQVSNSTQESCNDCPSGYVYNSSLKICVANLSCPEGGTLVYDSGRLRCVVDLQGTPNCPNGSSYDAGFNICYTSVACSLGTFDQNVGACVASFSCSNGTNYNPISKLCEKNSNCPEGTAYNNETGKCEREPVCQQGSIWDASIARCVSCPSGYIYDNASQACKSNNGTTTILPTFSFPCSNETIFNPNTSLCESEPICPAGFSFDKDLNACVATPTCPSGFSFNSMWGTCIAIPNCPSGFTLDASRGICVTNSSASCPTGYAYDSNLGKCVLAIFCPGGGAWDVVLNKCVKQSFCGSSSSSNYCVATPSCLNNGTWDVNMGKCVIDTPCSNATWVAVSQKSFYLGKWSESSDCEFACKVKVIEPKTGVYMKNSSTTFDLQYGTKTEKTGVSTTESYYYKPCVEEATNTWRCPIEGGEQMVDDCKCINNFSQAAVIMQVIRQAGQDFICSSGRLY
jgi:hypothetical protein